jgi:methionyl-tRNA formyltransferase
MVEAAGSAGSTELLGRRTLKLVFCGTPQFAVPTLEALIAASHDISLVLTQPDRPVGRKQVLTAPPVKQTALAHGIEVMQPEKIKNNLELRARLEAIAPDAIVVVAYGRIIPKWMLDLPRLGCINLHGSLLPKYRGAAPIQWAIANGDEVLGNTTMLLEEGLDTGPMLLQQSLAFESDFPNTSVEALKQLSTLGAPLVVQTLRGLDDGSIEPQPQDDQRATLAPILTREDGRIDFNKLDGLEIFNRWRAFQPWPGVFTSLEGKKLILNEIQPVAYGPPGGTHYQPGEVWSIGKDFFVACANKTQVELLEIQLEGKNRTTPYEFFQGHRLAPGYRLGSDPNQ